MDRERGPVVRMRERGPARFACQRKPGELLSDVVLPVCAACDPELTEENRKLLIRRCPEPLLRLTERRRRGPTVRCQMKAVKLPDQEHRRDVVDRP